MVKFYNMYMFVEIILRLDESGRLNFLTNFCTLKDFCSTKSSLSIFTQFEN